MGVYLIVVARILKCRVLPLSQAYYHQVTRPYMQNNNNKKNIYTSSKRHIHMLYFFFRNSLEHNALLYGEFFKR